MFTFIVDAYATIIGVVLLGAPFVVIAIPLLMDRQEDKRD